MLKRFSISLEHSLLDDFELFSRKRKYSNRSEAIRDLIHKAFVQEEWEADQEVGGITLDMAFTHPMERGPVMEMGQPGQFGVPASGGNKNLRPPCPENAPRRS